MIANGRPLARRCRTVPPALVQRHPGRSGARSVGSGANAVGDIGDAKRAKPLKSSFMTQFVAQVG